MSRPLLPIKVIGVLFLGCCPAYQEMRSNPNVTTFSTVYPFSSRILVRESARDTLGPEITTKHSRLPKKAFRCMSNTTVSTRKSKSSCSTLRDCFTSSPLLGILIIAILNSVQTVAKLQLEYPWLALHPVRASAQPKRETSCP